VRLGEDAATLCCSCDVTRGVIGKGIEGAVEGGATAAAAAAAYRIGGRITGAAGRGAGCCCKPALRIVDMGC
jgi:hypothetical protein